MTSPRTLRVALVACSGAKADRAAPAKDLYQGDLFKKSRAWAETHADRWYILSAKHYLLHPEKVIEPYEQRLPVDRDRLQGWAAVVDGMLRTDDATLRRASMHDRYQSPDLIGLGVWVRFGGDVQLTLLAGAAYCQPLLPRLEYWATVHRPLAGLGIGQQKAVLLHQPDQLDLFA